MSTYGGSVAFFVLLARVLLPLGSVALVRLAAVLKDLLLGSGHVLGLKLRVVVLDESRFSERHLGLAHLVAVHLLLSEERLLGRDGHLGRLVGFASQRVSHHLVVDRRILLLLKVLLLLVLPCILLFIL